MMLKFVLSYGFAWLTLTVCLFLCSKFLLRKRIQSAPGETYIKWTKINDAIKPLHNVLGFVVVGVALIHGLNSPKDVLSLHFGSLSWFLLLVIACTWLFKNRFQAQWLRIHRVLTVLIILAVTCHIADVGGIQIFEAWKSLQFLQEIGVDMAGDRPYLKDWMLP